MCMYNIHRCSSGSQSLSLFSVPALENLAEQIPELGKLSSVSSSLALPLFHPEVR